MQNPWFGAGFAPAAMEGIEVGEIINLRQYRKAREKAEKAARAAQNRALFGRPKTVKTLAEKRTTIEAARLEGHRLKGPDEE